MKQPYTFPKSRQQREFEDMARELVKLMAELQEEQQTALFEYAQQLYTERKSLIFTDWNERS